MTNLLHPMNRERKNPARAAVEGFSAHRLRHFQLKIKHVSSPEQHPSPRNLEYSFLMKYETENSLNPITYMYNVSGVLLFSNRKIIQKHIS